jgi:hypothetical protein
MAKKKVKHIQMGEKDIRIGRNISARLVILVRVVIVSVHSNLLTRHTRVPPYTVYVYSPYARYLRTISK